MSGENETVPQTVPVAHPPPPAQVAAIQLKLPPFWPKDPELWFVQKEAQFTTWGITVSSTKFDYIVASLSPEFATKVRDLLLCPLQKTHYNELKTELNNRTSTSEQSHLQELPSAEELGDRMPSQVLQCIQQLLSNTATIMDATLITYIPM